MKNIRAADDEYPWYDSALFVGGLLVALPVVIAIGTVQEIWQRIRLHAQDLHREMLSVYRETERISAERRRAVFSLFRRPRKMSVYEEDYDEHGRLVPNGPGDWAHEHACERHDGPPGSGR